jgi:ribosomal protein S18 acetylase RimI-like enzyme
MPAVRLSDVRPWETPGNCVFHYSDCNTMLVGTGDVPSALSFYQKCGFAESHRIKNFFMDNYDHPMFEDGKQLVDMVYLKRER